MVYLCWPSPVYHFRAFFGLHAICGVKPMAYSIGPSLWSSMNDLEARHQRRQEDLAKALAERKNSRLQKPRRRKLTVTIPLDLYGWLCSKVSDGTYFNISHGIEACVKQIKTRGVKRVE